jgi:hypothetical protein
MAAITMNTAPISPGGVQFLESVVITNQTANSTAVTKGVSVPSWATKGLFYIFFDSSAGTSPMFDFTLGMPDWGSTTLIASPTDATDVATLGNGAWNGITQITGNGPYVIVVEVGPDVTDDDTGSATASCTYSVKAELPPVITYTYTTDGTTDDEDYTFRIAVHWKA